MFISIYKAIAVKERELERLSSISNYSAHLMSFHSLPQPHSISQVIFNGNFYKGLVVGSEMELY